MECLSLKIVVRIRYALVYKMVLDDLKLLEDIDQIRFERVHRIPIELKGTSQRSKPNLG